MLVVDTFTQWLERWKARGMRKANGKVPLNAELILDIDRRTHGREIRWEHVRGHQGHGLNERADVLACAAAAEFAGTENAEKFLF